MSLWRVLLLVVLASPLLLAASVRLRRSPQQLYYPEIARYNQGYPGQWYPNSGYAPPSFGGAFGSSQAGAVNFNTPFGNFGGSVALGAGGGFGAQG